MRLTISQSAGSLKGEALSFLSGFSAWHYFGIWVSFISQITCLHSPTAKRQLIMCLHPLTTKWQLTSLRSLKIHVLAFFFFFFFLLQFLPPYQSWLQICFSADAHIANREVLPCPYHLVMIERGEERETASLSIILLTTIVSRRPKLQLPSPQPGECMRVSYFLVTLCLEDKDLKAIVREYFKFSILRGNFCRNVPS